MPFVISSRVLGRSLSLLTLVLGTGAALAQAPPADPAPSRPNIVLFVADDLGTHDTGPYGNAVVRTPALDRLAGEGLRFTRAFAASPTCAPSRSVMFTGLMPFRNGAHANHGSVRRGTRSLPHYFEPLGYRVALAGKLHVGPEEAFPFEYVEGSNVREPGYEDAHFLFIDLNMQAVDRWLSELPEDQPFLLVVADHSPHVIWPEKAAYDPVKVDVPSTHIDTPEYRASRARYYTDVEKMDRNVGLLLESLERHRLGDDTIVAFTSDQGPQWAFAKWSLYDPGIQAPLLVRWPGTVHPRQVTGVMVSLADLLPTFLEAAGGEVPEGLDGESFLPVLTGVRDAHRDAVFASHTGDRSFNRTPMRMVRTERYKYILNLAPENLFTTHMDKATDHDGGREYWSSWVERAFVDPHAAAVLWRYHHRPKEELYDLATDPQETRNLAARPEYAELLENFRTYLAAWRQKQGDDRTASEPPDAKPETKGGPYFIR